MFRDGLSDVPAARFISMTEKSLGIPAIRAQLLGYVSGKIPEKCQFLLILATSLCQADLFHVDEIWRLNRGPQALRKLFPAAIPLPGG